MGRTACTEPQCLYKGALYLYQAASTPERRGQASHSRRCVSVNMERQGTRDRAVKSATVSCIWRRHVWFPSTSVIGLYWLATKWTNGIHFAAGVMTSLCVSLGAPVCPRYLGMYMMWQVSALSHKRTLIVETDSLGNVSLVEPIPIAVSPRTCYWYFLLLSARELATDRCFFSTIPSRPTRGAPTDLLSEG